MHSPTMRTVSVQRTEESLQVPWSPGQEVWQNKTNSLGQPTSDKERQHPHQGHHRWGKEGNHLIRAHWFTVPHQNYLPRSVTRPYKHLGGRLGAMATASLLPSGSAATMPLLGESDSPRNIPTTRHLPQTERCLFYLHAQSDPDPSVPWELDPATKGLHAAAEDPACCKEDWRSHMPQLRPAGPSKNIHKYLKSTAEVVITAPCWVLTLKHLTKGFTYWHSLHS